MVESNRLWLAVGRQNGTERSSSRLSDAALDSAGKGGCGFERPRLVLVACSAVV